MDGARTRLATSPLAVTAISVLIVGNPAVVALGPVDRKLCDPGFRAGVPLSGGSQCI